MLKIATIYDIPELVRMSLLFKKNSPYADFAVDEDKLAELLASLIGAGPTDGLILLSIQDNKPVGMLAGIAREFIFSREKHATEIAWWVDKEYRGTSGKELQEAFAYWAKKIGCKYLHMTLLENKDLDKMKKLYKKLGFAPLEQAWIKRLDALEEI